MGVIWIYGVKGIFREVRKDIRDIYLREESIRESLKSRGREGLSMVKGKSKKKSGKKC